jgi:sigma-B regulation protein RsbU (phosphoserine phosphatase)
VRATLEGIRSFQGGAAQADDITILATTYYGEPEGTEVRVLHLSLVNRLDEIGRIHESFNSFAEEHGVPTPIRQQINLVLDELLSNVISYAFEDDEEREIDVRIELSSDRLAVTIADDGIPFNPFSSAPPDTSLSLEERELGGLGIHVVSKLMDEVSYNRRTNRNVVILVKYLNDSSGH